MHRLTLVSDMSALQILYEDEHLIGVVKPYGVLSQGNEKTKSLCDDVSAYLKDKGENDEIYVVHRLDKTTGGVIVYAKTKFMANKLSQLIAEHRFHKEYQAVVCGDMKERSGYMTDLLYHDKNKNKTYVVKRERKGVKEAKLCYVVHSKAVYNDSPVSKVQVLLKTGRTHQIRVQFASRKHPLVGDKKYGTTVSDSKIALWSHSITFVHPKTSKTVKISAKTDEGAFSAFKS